MDPSRLDTRRPVPTPPADPLAAGDPLELFEHAGVGLARVSLDGRWLWVNHRLCTIVGFSREELLQHTFQILTHPADLERTHQLLQQALNAMDAPVSLEMRYVREDGSVIWVQVTIAVARRADGTPAHFISATEEITERKAVEAALRASEQRHRALLETVPQILWTLRPDGTVDYFNGQWYAYTGHARDEQDLRGWGHVLHPDDRPRAAVLREEHIPRGLAYDLEVRLRRADDGYRWHHVRVSPLRGAAGELLGWVGAAVDIHDRRRALEQLTFLDAASHTLRASLDYHTTLRNLARLTLPALADYCFIDLMEADGRIVRVEMAHRDPDKDGLLREAQGRYPPNPQNPVRDVLAGGPTFLQEHVSEQLIDAVAHDARHRALLQILAPVSWLIVPMRTAERTVGAISLVLTADSGRQYSPDDVTLSEELGRRAALAVEHAELYARAQAGIRLRDNFLSVATHELRSPLTALHGTAQILLRQRQRSSTLDEREVAQLQRIVAQAARLGQLIGTLLDFSRLHAGQLELALQPVDLVRLARSVVEEIQPTLAIHSLTCDGPPEGSWVRGDPLRLAQVLHNLITNAVKYSPAGGPITIRVARHDQWACLAVSDQGIGIPQEDQGRLFEQFYRAENAQAFAPGLGLGLAVTHEIVSRHGGTIAVTSEEGVGSTFTVCLPLVERRPGLGRPDSAG